MKNFFNKIMLLSALIGFVFVLPVFADTTLDAAEQYIQRLQFYENMDDKGAPISVSEAGEEIVKRANGGITYKKTDLALPGKGGMGVELMRKLNSKSNMDDNGVTQQLSISGITSIYKRNTSHKYLFQYYVNNNTSTTPVYIAFDSPQHMLEAEDGENKINVAATYAGEYEIASNQHNSSGIMTIQYGLDSDSGFNLGDRYYIYNNLPQGDDVTLYRDLSCGYSGLDISSIWASSYNSDRILKDQPIGGGWTWELLTVQYRRTIPKLVTKNGGQELTIFNGLLYDQNRTVYYCLNGRITDEGEGRDIYPDSGTFYMQAPDIVGRIPYTACLEDGAYWLVNEPLGLRIVLIPQINTMEWKFDEEGTFYNPEDGTCLDFKYRFYMDIGNLIDNEFYSARLFSYQPSGSTYGTKYSDMYTLELEQNRHDDPLYMTFNKFDGTSYQFDMGIGSAFYWVNGNPDTQMASGKLISKTDRYNNKMTYSYSRKNLIIKDTLNREITAGPSGIKVNDTPIVNYTVTERINDDIVDPNNKLFEDETYSLKVKYIDTGKEFDYRTRKRTDTYVIGSHEDIEYTLGIYNMCIDSILYPTGAQSIYKYQYKRNRDTLSSNYRDTSFLLRHYDKTAPNASNENEIQFIYDLNNTEARRVTLLKTGSTGYSVNETYNKYGYLTSAEETNSESGNVYYKSTDYEYTYQNEGNFLPVKETTTVKASAASTPAQTVVIDKEYNIRQQLTAQKRDGDYILTRMTLLMGF